MSTMTSLRATLLGAAVVCLCAVPSSLLAQPAQPAAPLPLPEDPDFDKAQRLFLEGREAVKKGDHKRALELFSQSQELHPSAGTMLNVASCEEQVGKTASAWQHYSLVMSQMLEGDDRLPIAKEGVARVAPRVSYLRVDRAAGAPQAMRIKRGESLLAAASLGVEQPLDPGAYVVTSEAPSHEARRYEVKLIEGQRLSLVVDAGNEIAKVVEAPPLPKPLPNPLRPVAFALGGAGIAGLGVFAVTGILAIVKKSDLQKACPNPAKCTPAGLAIQGSGRALAGVSTASLIVGLVSAGAGTALFLMTGEKAKPATAAFVPAALPGGAAVAASGRF
jgi:hypothetical protein